MEYRLILINLLVKLGMAAAIAAGLARSVEFKSLLFREDRSTKDKFYMALWFAISEWIGFYLALGIRVRFGAQSTFAGDLTFEATVLLGVIAGRFAGVTGGVLLALFNEERLRRVLAVMLDEAEFLGPHGIRVNAVCPGAVAGPRIDQVLARQAAARGITEEAVRAELTGLSPLRRLVQAEEVAAACVYLASDGSAAVTGEDVNVTTGVVMY